MLGACPMAVVLWLPWGRRLDRITRESERRRRRRERQESDSSSAALLEKPNLAPNDLAAVELSAVALAKVEEPNKTLGVNEQIEVITTLRRLWPSSGG